MYTVALGKLAGKTGGFDDTEYPELVRKAREAFAGQENREWLAWGGSLMVGLKRVVEDEKAAEAAKRGTAEARAAEEEKRRALLSQLFEEYMESEGMSRDEYRARRKELGDVVSDDEGGVEEETLKDVEESGTTGAAGNEVTEGEEGEKTMRVGEQTEQKQEKESGEEKKKMSGGDGGEKTGIPKTRKMKPVVEIRTATRRKREAEKETENVEENEADEADPEAEAEKKWGKVVWLVEGEGVSDFNSQDTIADEIFHSATIARVWYAETERAD